MIDLRQRHTVNVSLLLTGVTITLALALTLGPAYQPRQLRMPDPWAYAFAGENFAQGRWVVTDAQLAAGRMQAHLQGGNLTQYILVAPNRWALEKAPGYPLLMAPFQWLEQPRLTNAVLAVFVALVIYHLLATWRDGFTAWIGVTVFLLSPISLISLRHTTMDSFASGALPAIGGALCLLYDQRTAQGRGLRGWLFLSGLAIGWAVVVRFTNVLLLILISFFVVRSVRKRRSAITHSWQHLAAWGLGCGLALAVLALYNLTVFGQVFDSGYRYSPYQADFVWGGSGIVDIAGNLTWRVQGTVAAALTIVVYQFSQWLQPMLLGWPILPLALAELCLGWRGRRQPMPGWFAGLWLLAAYLPYAGIIHFGVLRDLGSLFIRSWGFFAIDRYLFPAMLPITLLALGLLTRMPRWLATAGILLYAAGCVWLYVNILATGKA